MVKQGDVLSHITVVIHDIEGGVASMNYQIIENADFRRYFHVHILLWRAAEDTAKPFHDRFTNALDVRRFSFSKYDNYHRTLRRFHALIDEFPGLVVTND